MTLHPPFAISSRLCPALQIGQAWISYDKGQFIIDLPDGGEHTTSSFAAGAGRDLPGCFADLLSFLGACAESRAYAVRQGKPAMDGENSDLFPDDVGAWAESVADDLAMLQMEIEESERELIEA